MKHVCGPSCRVFLDAIEDWRAGKKGSPGLSPLGDRYARDMQDEVRRLVRLLRGLGHFVPTDLG